MARVGRRLSAPGDVLPKDGIDQNCDGYDTTLTITKAVWSQKRRLLTVEATSDYANAYPTVGYWDASLNGYSYAGVMTYLPKRNLWQLVFSIIADPGSVRAGALEGGTTATVTTVREIADLTARPMFNQSRFDKRTPELVITASGRDRRYPSKRAV